MFHGLPLQLPGLIVAGGLALGACRPQAAPSPASPDATPRPADPEPLTGAEYVAAHYEKREVRIPMRDGVKLFTAVYTPRDRTRTYPFLMKRTPYGVAPYGPDAFPDSLGPTGSFMEEGYIFVYQDVRGQRMSEGTFLNMTPHRPDKKGPGDVDESTDTHDTISWLLAHLEGHNGKVGQYGTSYPGFYAAAGMIDHHPSLVAVSPQAPIADWFFDDFHHHGAFFLPHAFNFLYVFGQPRPEPTPDRGERLEHGTPDGYDFFLRLGPLSNVENYYQDKVEFWKEIVAHPNYDAFWQSRNLLPHLKDVAPAVLTVGGWFDAEDLYGPLKIYGAIEDNNPQVENSIVMGPWAHGGWHRGDGETLGHAHFGSKTALAFQEQIELPFFRHHLKGGPDPKLPEAFMFETGGNRWRSFQSWPPETGSRILYLDDGGQLTEKPPERSGAAFDAFVSDPHRPVPAFEDISTSMTRTYMTDDQRFAARRPDVLVFQTGVLARDVVVAGPMEVELIVSTSQYDADWIVKLVDVYPPNAPDHEGLKPGQHMGNAHLMVRSEAIRGRFRHSYSDPRPFTPGKATRVKLPLQDVLHRFEAGHRIQIQIQSTFFPIIDRNPQAWVDNIFQARAEDFVSATHKVFHAPGRASRVILPVLPD